MNRKLKGILHLLSAASAALLLTACPRPSGRAYAPAEAESAAPDYTFYNRYHALKVRIAPFRLRQDAETAKTLGTIDALLDRADVIHNGNRVGGYILGPAPGIDEDNLVTRAERYVEALERGEQPLKGKFTEPGVSLADHSFIIRDGVLHVFYNRGAIGYDWPERSVETIGHAWTENLTDWTVGPPVLSAQAGFFEDFAVWSPSVFEHDGKYHMLYTGVNMHACEALCLASSDDLYAWTKYGTLPVYIPGDWGDWDENRWSDCRDPFVFRDGDGTFYLFFCTMVGKGAAAHNAMGIASSTDLVHWKDEKQFLIEGCDHMPESPFVIRHGGRYYLFFTNVGRGTAYAVSDSILGDWQVRGLLLTVDKLSEDLAHVPSCAEVFEFKGKWYISWCTRLPGNEQYLELKEFFWRPDGTVSVGRQIGT